MIIAIKYILVNKLLFIIFLHIISFFTYNDFSIHDLHEHDGFVSFDLVRPDGFDISDEELLELVTRIVHERRPDVSCVVTFDSGFSSPDRPAEQL